MKIRLSRKLKQMASALLVVMVLGGLLCMFVMYYLALVQQQNTLSVRSQAWNIAIAISEAGIEEGLQALNSSGTLSSTDGWQLLSDGRYWRTNTMADGNRYEVAINTTLREIIARAYVVLPALAANTPLTFFAAQGVTTANPCIVSRAVRVRYANNGLFLAAMVAKHKIDLKGNGVLTDSFDSGSLWKSYFGHYNASVYAGDMGDVASDDGVVSTISVQNANIYGKAHTGAEGSVTVGSQGAVGTHAWQQGPPAHTGFEDGYVLQDANFTFPNTSLPYSTGLPLGGPATIVTTTYNITSSSTTSTVYPNPAPWSGVTENHLTTPTTTSSYPAPGTYFGSVTTNYAGGSSNEKTFTYNQIIGTNYTYAVYQTNAVYMTNYYNHVIDTPGNYYTTDDLHGSTIVLANASLVLPSGLSMSGNDQITIAPNGSLQMFCGGSQCTVGGNGVINQSGYAQNFILECTPSVTTFNFNGNGEFIGVLVAPNADMALNGGGKSNNDFIGALMMNSIGMNGHFSFHYDEALSLLKNNPRLLITSWDEIP